MTGIGFGSMLG